MKTENFEFISFNATDISNLVSRREGETKIGEKVQVGWPSKGKYVLIGVQEDIGPQANFGRPGSTAAFSSMLSRFLNMQSNRFLSGDEICVAGFVRQLTSFSSVEVGRKQVEELDALLIDLLIPIYKNDQLPIIVGGGHNNAYPLIAAYSKVFNKPLEVVNLDPHADCRRLEGRHSGNSFSYAKENGFLKMYSVLGLHRAYNGENMLRYLDENQFFYSFFEDYIKTPAKLLDDIQGVLGGSEEAIGVELDLDAIKNMPTSAFTPSGLEIEQVRAYLSGIVNSGRNVAYLHLPEGAPTNEMEEKIVGKSIAYLVHDFLVNRKLGQ
ncbi:MAG: formimidoylglutamase [Crocinitomicaceae bacterium]|nr:formimidoylglutamase [Crocinitomicaceae bacterium]